MQLPFFSAAQVHAALGYDVLIEALREAFREGCTVPLRHVHEVSGAGDRLLLMPAWRAGRDLGIKLVTVFPRNRERGAATVSALYVLLDGATGHPRALIDGEALTLRRTAAASALASSYLSRAVSSKLLLIGTGAPASSVVNVVSDSAGSVSVTFPDGTPTGPNFLKYSPSAVRITWNSFTPGGSPAIVIGRSHFAFDTWIV
jgi:ornithine cyclodeaminase/alanine dehydrogenase-like protein (mu-crystallin family)